MISFILCRSNSLNPDVRAEKYFNYLKKSDNYKFYLLGWKRDSENPFSSDSVYSVFFDYKTGFGRGLSNLLPLIFFQFWLFFKILFFSKKNKIIVHACDFDTAFACYLALKIRSFFGLKDKLIYDIFDFYVEAFPVHKIAKPFILFFESLIFNFSSLIILADASRVFQINHHFKFNKEKILVIENSVDINLNFDEKILVEKNDTKIKIGYSGVLAEHRSLVHFSNLVLKNSNVEFHVIGFGQLGVFFSSLNISNIFFYGKKKHDEAMHVMSQMDFLYALYDPTLENHKYASPNKLFESMQLGIPLLAFRDCSFDVFLDNDINSVILDFPINYLPIDRLISLKHKFDKNKWQKLYKDNYSSKVLSFRYLKALNVIVDSELAL